MWRRSTIHWSAIRRVGSPSVLKNSIDVLYTDCSNLMIDYVSERRRTIEWPTNFFLSFSHLLFSGESFFGSFLLFFFSLRTSRRRLIFSERQPINTRRCRSLSEQIVQEFGRRFRLFGCFGNQLFSRRRVCGSNPFFT